MREFRISTHGRSEFNDQGEHQFEHWYRDRTVYFVTARCRDGFAAFASEQAKQVFWDRFQHYAKKYGLEPWVVSLLHNHYHFVGYLELGANLGPMMQRIHGAVAKLVNDLLPERRVPFWRDGNDNDYFDGCLRDEIQCRRACRYTLNQAVRANIVKHFEDYPHTRVYVDLEEKIQWALRSNAFMTGVDYPRYDRSGRDRRDR